MLKNALGFRQLAAVALALAASTGGAQTTVQQPGTYVDRTAEGVTANAEASRAVQAARTANEQADSREKARLDALRASLESDARQKESRQAAANLELERQMEKSRQETYQYYRATGEAYYQSARHKQPNKPAAGSAARARKPDAPRDDQRPDCAIRPVMTDAEIEALRRCR